MEHQTGHPVSRRQFVGQGIAAALVLGCGGTGTDPMDHSGHPRITTTRVAPSSNLAPGDYALGFDSPRDGRLHVPPGYDPAHAAPLVLGFHDKGALGFDWNHAVQPAGDAIGAVLLAPDSRGTLWDALSGPFAQDVLFVDRALAYVYQHLNIDPNRIFMGGFGDGASYALSLGLANGDMFTRVVGFSPGLIVPAARVGKPKFFIAHGTGDPSLPIATTGRTISANLQAGGYDVTYHEFDGPHVIDTSQRDAAFAWLMGG